MTNKNKKRSNQKQLQKKSTAPEKPVAKVAESHLEIPETILRKLEPEERQTLQAVVMSYQGPIPHHDALASYEAITPGLADRIVAMAERESSHRHDVDKIHADLTRSQISCEKEANSDNTTLNKRAQIFALLIAILGVGGGLFLSYIGHEKSGITLMSLTMGTMGIAYLKNGNKNGDQ